MWIECVTYVGPCRRTGQQGQRFFERRRRSQSAPRPALVTIVRRLRMTDLAFASDHASSAFRLGLAGALQLARQKQSPAAEALSRALGAYDSSPNPADASASVAAELKAAYVLLD